MHMPMHRAHEHGHAYRHARSYAHAQVRAKILRGMHLVQPIDKKPGLTNFTFTQQVNAGGVIPAWLMNTLVAQDSVVFIKRLGTAAGARS